MADLMPEERDWLIKYCMESEENVRLALKIGQIQSDLQRAIMRSFFERLSESIGARLKECSPESRWNPSEIREGGTGGRDMSYSMTMEEYQIELLLWYQGGPKDFFIAVPSGCEACPTADRVKPYIEGEGLKLQTNYEEHWRWWFYAGGDHTSLKDLATLLDKQIRDEKAEYFTWALVHSASAISKALEE